MKMSEPTIVYGTLEQPIHTNGQYLLMKAEITDGTYTTQDFIDKMNSVSLDEITLKKGRSDVNNLRTFMQTFAEKGDTVTIRDFNPDREYLETFVNTSFQEVYEKLNR